MTKDKAKQIWGVRSLDFPEVVEFLEARLMLTKEEADAARQEAEDREARHRRG